MENEKLACKGGPQAVTEPMPVHPVVGKEEREDCHYCGLRCHCRN